MPIEISRNHAFTLWTRPAQVTAIPMKNGLTAAQLASASAPTIAAPPAMVTKPQQTSPAPTPFAHRLLPLAAGIVAIMGLNALVRAAKSKETAAIQSEVSELNLKLNKAGEGQAEMKAASDKAAVDLAEKAAQLEAKFLVAKEENARLVTNLTMAQETLRKAEATVAEQETSVRELAKKAQEAQLLASTADTRAQTLVVAATEEASAIKREAAAELVKLKETLARLEAEKAAALKAAATAAQEKATLQQALELVKKPAP